MSLREAEREFWERSREVNEEEHWEWERGGMAAGPERLVDFKESDWRLSRVRRKVAMTVRFVVRGTPERSMEVRCWVSLQVMPVNEHGLWFGSQFGSRVGFGREFLKLRSCRVGTEEEDAEQTERKKRSKRELLYRAFIFARYGR